MTSIYWLVKFGFTIIALHLAMYIKVMDDFFKISNGLEVCHSEGAGLNAILFTILSVLLFKEPIDILTCFFIIATYYWIMFDIWLNKVRGLDANYLGRVAVTDKVLRFIGIKKIIYVKLFLLLLIIILRIVLF